MNVVVPINSFAEILFDNSEEIPNNIYVNFMNLLKEYHETGQNIREIKKYLKKVDKKIRVQLEKHMPIEYNEPYCECSCSCINCCTDSCYTKFKVISGLIFLAIFIGIIVFCIASKPYNHLYAKSPPPK